MTRIRVLHVYQSFPPEFVGGLEESIRQICYATSKGSVENSVVYLSNRFSNQDEAEQTLPHEGAEEPTVYRARRFAVLWSCAFPSPPAFVKLVRLMQCADLVHLHLPWPVADIAKLCFVRGVPCVATYHADIERQRSANLLYRRILNSLLRGVDRIVATSPDYAASSDVLLTHTAKTSIIPLCLSDSQAHLPQEMRPGCLGELRRPFALFIGVLRYYKGLDSLLDAARRTRYNIVIAGTGPLISAVRMRVAKESISNVVLTGQVSEQEKAWLLNNCATLVLPSSSRAEAFGMVLLEAMRAGRPTITTDIDSGMRYVQGYGECGRLVKPGDANGLAAAIDELCKNEDTQRALGAAGFARYKQLFTPTEVGARYTQLYKDVLAERRKQL